jgi:hypothetical protein
MIAALKNSLGDIFARPRHGRFTVEPMSACRTGRVDGFKYRDRAKYDV